GPVQPDRQRRTALPRLPVGPVAEGVLQPRGTLLAGRDPSATGCTSPYPLRRMSAAKSARVQRLEAEALDILASVGIPVDDKTVRAKQMMAVCFLSVAGVTKAWSEAKGLDDHRHLKTREIIAFANQHLEEKISPGSYDDIRRKHLKLMVLADLVVNSGI